MDNPFVFGQVVTGNDFTNRQSEKKQLERNILNGIHTVIISPRRWGKSSLVEEVADDLQHKRVVQHIRMDLSTVVDETDFYNRYLKAVLKATSTRTEELLDHIKSYFKNIKPTITFETADSGFAFGINLSGKDIEKGYEDILNFPEALARKKKIRLLVSIDEFQNVGSFNHPDVFQGQLRSVLQFHKSVSYVLYGSRKHMMEEIFQNRSMPFYNFGDVIWLRKITLADFVPFIARKFEKTGKKITIERATRIVNYMDRNPQYVQLLANKVWELSDKSVTEKNIESAVEMILYQYEDFFQNAFEDLSKYQKNFLFGLLEIGDETIFSATFINRNNLSSSANVERIKTSLIKKDIIEITDGVPAFIDPAFRLWLQRRSA